MSLIGDEEMGPAALGVDRRQLSTRGTGPHDAFTVRSTRSKCSAVPRARANSGTKRTPRLAAQGKITAEDGEGKITA